MLTSSAYIAPLSALWKLGDQQEHAFDIPEEYFVQFSNLSSERIIGTSDVVGSVSVSVSPADFLLTFLTS